MKFSLQSPALRYLQRLRKFKSILISCVVTEHSLISQNQEIQKPKIEILSRSGKIKNQLESKYLRKHSKT